MLATTEKKLKKDVAYLGLSCPPSIYICQNLMYPSWLAVANTVPSGDRAPSLTLCRGGHKKNMQFFCIFCKKFCKMFSFVRNCYNFRTLEKILFF